jgi:N-acetylglucosaminyl-diphospho-decaprenol L-rhamnosyltransferase
VKNGYRSVTLVAVTYNEAEVLEEFFGALPAALEGVDEYHVVVADNASKDGSPEVAKRLWPDAVVVQTGGNLGYAAGINRAVAAAPRTDAIYILNPDIRLEPKSIRPLLDSLGERGVGITVPKLYDGTGRLIKSMRREPSLSRAWGEALLGGSRSGRVDWLGETILDPDEYDYPQDAAWASGCTFMIARECWDAVGPWDESFWLYSEETGFALDARDAGFRLRFVPQSEAVHLMGPSHQNPLLWSILVCNKARLFRRRNGVVKGAAFYVALVVGEAIRSGRSRIHRAALKALLFPSARPAQIGHTQKLLGA